MDERDDPDLPCDEDFAPVSSGSRVIDLGESRGPRIAMMMAISPDEQAAQHHNRLRYAELAALRLGLPNRYAETRYRH